MRCRFDGSVIFTISLYRSLFVCVDPTAPANVFSLGPGISGSGNIVSQLMDQGFRVSMGLLNETKVYLVRDENCPNGFTRDKMICEGERSQVTSGTGEFRGLFFALIGLFAMVLFLLILYMQKPVMKSTHWKNEVFFVKNKTPGFPVGRSVCVIEETRFLNDRYEPRMRIHVAADSGHTYLFIFHEMEEGFSKKVYSIVEPNAVVQTEEREHYVNIDVKIDKRELEHPEFSFEFQKSRIKFSPQRGMGQLPWGNETLVFSLEARLCLRLVSECLSIVRDVRTLRECCKMVGEAMDFVVLALFLNKGNDVEELAFWAEDESVRDSVVKMARESKGSNVIQTVNGIRYLTMTFAGMVVIVGPPPNVILRRSLMTAFIHILVCFMYVCKGLTNSNSRIIENMSRLFRDASTVFLEVDRDNSCIRSYDESLIDSLVQSLGGCDVILNSQPGYSVWTTKSNELLNVWGLEYHLKSTGKSVLNVVVARKNPLLTDDKLFISLFSTAYAPFEANSVVLPDDKCFIDSVPKTNGSCRVLNNGKCLIFTRTGVENGFAIEIPRPEEDFEGLVCKEDIGMAIWMVNPSTLQVVWCLGAESCHGNSDWKTYACEICHPESLPEVERAIDHFQAVDSMSLTMEVQLKLGSDDYRWYLIFWWRTAGSNLIICASCIDEYRSQIQIIKETDEQVKLGLEYGRIRLCYFDDAHSPSRILSPSSDSSSVMQLNWSSVKHCILTEWQAAATECFKEALVSQQPFSIELPVIPGLFTWQSVRGVSTGRPGKLMMAAIDVTELKEATLALQESKRSFEEAVAIKSRFLLNISCAVQPPLYNILSLYELVSGTFTNPDDKAMIDIVGTSVTRMLELLGDTLDLSMLEQNRMQVNFTKFDAREVLCWKVDHFNKIAKSKGITMVLKVPGKFPIFYYGELHFFVRIICNVLSNAVKFTEHGSITVYMNDLDDGSIEFVVSDTGIGISPEDQERIWDAFTQGDNSITRPYGGIGVGLTLMKRMLDRIHGKVSVESKLGEGSTFRVIFPFEPVFFAYIPKTLRDSHFEIFSCVSDPSELVGLRELTDLYNVKIVQDPELLTSQLVLTVVDDKDDLKQKALEVYEQHKVFTVLITTDVDAGHDQRFHCVNKAYAFVKLFEITRTMMWNKACDRSLGKAKSFSFEHCKLFIFNENVTEHLILRRITERLGCEAVITATAGDIVNRIRDGGFNVVIFNMIMSLVDGLAIAEKIVREGKLDIPMIALSTNFTSDDIERCKKDGIHYFLRKPLTMQKVSDVLRAALTDSKL